MNVVIVMPTYNERKNVGRLIEVLQDEFSKYSEHDFHILFVDGNSPDGTGDVIKEKKAKYNNVHLLTETEKSGLGSAYMMAFKYVMKDMDADVVMEMDADFQHDPKDVIRLVNEIENGADHVIGSRYVKGGGIPKEWAFYRKFLSRGGSIFTRIVLGVRGVTDYTSGFRATRIKGVLDRIDLDTIISNGYSYKIDLLDRMNKLGAKIVEIPIIFGLRGEGVSKMEKNNMMDSLRVVLSIKFSQNKSFFRFIVVGFVGLGVDLTLSNTLRLTALRPNVAASISAFIAMVCTFVLNNTWSFDDRKKTGLSELAVHFVPYAVLSMVPVVFRYYLVGYVVDRFGNTFLVYNAALFVAILFGLIWNYTSYSKLIWRKKKDA